MIDVRNVLENYGFLAPGTTAALNAASEGKIYTVRIAESLTAVLL
jgi:hypothetical protein